MELEIIKGALIATNVAAEELIDRKKDFERDGGLSLLDIRPNLLAMSLHHLTHLLALRLSGQADPQPSFAASLKDVTPLEAENMADLLAGDLMVGREIMDKVSNMESKISHQIKKLIQIAETEEKRDNQSEDEDEDEDYQFGPRAEGIVDIAERKPRSDGKKEVYRPPRIAAVPYNEPSAPKRKERRAPALLSEFAQTLTGAPVTETTSGLAVRPTGAHSNSISAKRAAELARIKEFEEENMTRLVTTKREAKRRREDEEALMLGYGTGGRRRRNAIEAEMEGVLGDRGSRGVWEGVKSLGDRGGVLQRGRGKPENIGATDDRFERDVQRRKKHSKR